MLQTQQATYQALEIMPRSQRISMITIINNSTIIIGCTKSISDISDWLKYPAVYTELPNDSKCSDVSKMPDIFPSKTETTAICSENSFLLSACL